MTTTDPGAAHLVRDSHAMPGGTGHYSASDQGRIAAHRRSVADGPFSAIGHRRSDNLPLTADSGPTLADPAQVVGGSHWHFGGVSEPSTVSAQAALDSHSPNAADGPTPTDPPNDHSPARAEAAGPSASTPPGAPTCRSQATDATASPEAQTPPAPATTRPSPTHDAPVLADPLLALSADVLDDLERVRIANENRLRQLTRTATDADGEDRGFGLDESHPDVARLAALVEALGKAEHTAELNLSRQMRAHALGPWVKTTTGVGEKQAARLLACIGDPYMRPELERDGEVEPARPRLVSELWSYCGYGDARAQVRRRGVQANWDDTAKKRAWLISKSGVRSLRAPCHVPEGQSWAEHTADCRCGPYRLVYDEARRKYDGTVHPEECKRCGPSGKPAVAGSLRSAGHQEAMALRAMSKALLRDLWREARRLHGVTDEEGSA